MMTKQQAQERALSQISTLSLHRKMEMELDKSASSGLFEASLVVDESELDQADQVIESLKLRGFSATKAEVTEDDVTVTTISATFGFVE